MLQPAPSPAAEGRFHGLVNRVLEVTRSQSLVIFLCDRSHAEPVVHYLFMHGVTDSVARDYSDHEIHRYDPFLNPTVLKRRACDRALMIVEGCDDDIRQCAEAENYWRFVERSDLHIVGATVRPIREDLLLVVGLHGKTGANPVAVAAASEEIEGLVDTVMSRAFQRVLERVEPHRILEATGMPQQAAGITAPPSRRENEIICLVKQGLRNKEIAFKLQISENTVETHLRRIYHKMGVNNRTSLINRHSEATRL
ncbi:response regulator transcription factor [Bradyrhizobium tropiciagri]|uniref:helix-turn-helix transcriptional regulator n=1 Tax=Bradyrhizobium tropiciagri TaxID=312253 RepID=UPI001BA9261A|nr:LuxR C-terminal-related transcriptional regulator [Bradyrhizobium tropiciagri]MBR0873306.1 response regulator transcription factor [Bradyrhizobium tropiciagri]